MPADGILSLNELLASMSPELEEGETFVFHTSTNSPFTTLFNPETPGDIEMLFHEREGWTVILRKQRAEALGLETTFPCKKITLNVHSSLDAVGFLATVTTKLAEEVDIGVNPVSGYYHDHLFVPDGKEGEVMEVLRTMAEEAGVDRSS